MVNVVKQEQKNKAVKESRGAAALHKADLQVFEVESPLWLSELGTFSNPGKQQRAFNPAYAKPRSALNNWERQR